MYRGREDDKMKKKTIAIGISAYNEENNIQELLLDILNQRLQAASIEHIIIVSDGSTDRTALVAKFIKDPKIKIKKGITRQGKAARQNEIISKCQSDILIFMDADISIEDHQFIAKLISPIIEKKAEMTSSSISPLNPQTFFEQVLYVSSKIKGILFSQYKNGNNVYTCYGPARAFSKKFYRKLRFQTSNGDDMYSYFLCRELGYRFQNIPGAISIYKLPSTLRDHSKQSIRYHQAKNQIKKYFDTDLVKNEQKIPLTVYIVTLFKALPIILKYPIHTTIYFLILASILIRSLSKYQAMENWNATTTKILRSQI